MSKDLAQNAERSMEDAMSAIESAWQSLECAKSTQGGITRRLQFLIRCRGELRIAKDVLDILLMMPLEMATLSLLTENAGLDVQSCPTEKTDEPFTL